MKKDLRSRLAAGAIGLVLGASSMHAAYQVSEATAYIRGVRIGTVRSRAVEAERLDLLDRANVRVRGDANANTGF